MMNEEKAIDILRNRKEYYNMKHKGYDAVIKWLEGRMKREKRKLFKELSEVLNNHEKRIKSLEGDSK